MYVSQHVKLKITFIRKVGYTEVIIVVVLACLSTYPHDQQKKEPSFAESSLFCLKIMTLITRKHYFMVYNSL